MLMSQRLTITWLSYIVNWVIKGRRKTVSRRRWLLGLKISDLSMLMSQRLTITWVSCTVNWVM